MVCAISAVPFTYDGSNWKNTVTPDEYTASSYLFEPLTAALASIAGER